MQKKVSDSVFGAIKIAGLYLLIGFLWILFSDQLADLFAKNERMFHQVSTYKGWGYILVTGILLFFLIKNHGDQISASETWRHRAYGAADMGTWQHNISTGVVRFDDRARVQHGFGEGEYEVLFTDILARIHPDDVSLLRERISNAVADPSANGYFSIEFRIIHRDESVHWLGVDAHVRVEKDGKKRRSVLAAGTSRDVTESKQANLQIRYFMRLYATLSQVNQAIVRCADRQELFNAICRVAVEFGEFRLAWVGLLDDDADTLHSSAEYGFRGNQFPFQQIDLGKIPFQGDLTGLALSSGRVEICKDVQVEPYMAHWREVAIRDQYRSAAAVPIRQDARIIGLLVLFALDSDFFKAPEEKKLLEEMGMDISYALDSFQVEKQHERARKDLMKAEERFQKAFTSGPVGLAITRASDGVYIDANPSFSAIVGYGQEELIGQTSLGLNITTPAQKEEYTRLIREHGLVHNLEMTLRNRSGGQRVVLGSMEVIELNNETCVLSTAIDITDRKAADEKLHESEQRFRQLVDNIEEVFWIFDPLANKEVYISPAFEKIWMRPVKTLYDDSSQFFETILAEDRAHVREITSRQPHGEKTEMKYRILRPDGSIRWVWDRGFPVFDENGKITRIVAIVSDISEQKKAEIELLELNQNLEQRVNERTAEVVDLYENAPAGYHSLDVNGVFVRINKTELNWLGYAREEILGVKTFADVITADSKRIFHENYPNFKKQGRIGDLEFELVRKDGSILPVLLNATAIYDEHGNYVMSRSTMVDITERKQAELQLQTANLELEKAAKLKDEFLANMSHELRTPLNAIIGLSESLQIGTYGELAPRQENTLRVIRESGQHLLELINDILDLSKIEAGMLDLQYEPVDLKTVCEASLLMVHEAARKKELQISTSITDQIQTIQADKRRLKQMIVNLLSNAVKFTPQFGSIGLEILPENEHAVRFTVRDTGIGISAEQLENLFKPFVQVDSSLARKFEGTGLGLALVRQLAEKHNGSIGVESTPGKGSNFYFIIPRQPLQGFAEEEALISNEAPLEQSSITPSSVTILLVEDNPTNMMFTGDYLTAKGFNLVTAENGLQALEQAELYNPDLILMDIQMPEMDGIETIRRLRSTPRFATVPIIALTALAMPGDRDRCLEAGASEYLAKPVSLKKLFAMVSSLLEAHRRPSGPN